MNARAWIDCMSMTSRSLKIDDDVMIYCTGEVGMLQKRFQQSKNRYKNLHDRFPLNRDDSDASSLLLTSSPLPDEDPWSEDEDQFRRLACLHCTSARWWRHLRLLAFDQSDFNTDDVTHQLMTSRFLLFSIDLIRTIKFVPFSYFLFCRLFWLVESK